MVPVVRVIGRRLVRRIANKPTPYHTSVGNGTVANELR
jgi:hypothetical protein